MSRGVGRPYKRRGTQKRRTKAAKNADAVIQMDEIRKKTRSHTTSTNTIIGSTGGQKTTGKYVYSVGEAGSNEKENHYLTILNDF